MASLYPAMAHQTQATLPRLTIEDFEAFGVGTRDIGRFEFVTYAPLLKSHDDLMVWNAYSANSTEWIEHGREFNHDDQHSFVHGDHHDHRRDLEADEDHDAEHDADHDAEHDAEHDADHDAEHDEDHDAAHEHEGVEIVEHVHFTDSQGQTVEAVGSQGFPIAPIWQTSPVPDDTSVINYNLASIPSFAAQLENMIKTASPILAEAGNLQEMLGVLATSDAEETPHSLLLEPVFDAFSHEKEPVVVGALVTVLEWEQFFHSVSSTDR